MNRFTHFEFVTDDFEKTAHFYRTVFGWKVEKYEGPVDYWMVTSGDASSVGINGGLMPAGGPFSGTVNTIEVENIDEYIPKVAANGGEFIFPKDAIPGVGWIAYFKDPTGIICGLHQADEKAGM